MVFVAVARCIYREILTKRGGMVKGEFVESEVLELSPKIQGMSAGLIGKTSLCAGVKGMSSWLSS